MKKVNFLGFLSLLALIALLGWKNEQTGLYGFFGFVYFIRYFWVIPDELFMMNVRKAATTAFMAGMVALVPVMFAASFLYGVSAAIPMAFAVSFVAAVLLFSLSLAVLEWKEQRGALE